MEKKAILQSRPSLVNCTSCYHSFTTKSRSLRSLSYYQKQSKVLFGGFRGPNSPFEVSARPWPQECLLVPGGGELTPWDCTGDSADSGSELTSTREKQTKKENNKRNRNKRYTEEYFPVSQRTLSYGEGQGRADDLPRLLKTLTGVPGMLRAAGCPRFVLPRTAAKDLASCSWCRQPPT